MDLFSLRGRVALVTGGSRGIGRMIVEGFLEHGAKVYISSRTASVCAQVAAELSVDGRECIALPEDISTVDGVRRLAKRLTELEPRLDILVNNAGADWIGDFDETTEQGWDDVMDINLKSPFFLTQALHGDLKAAASFERPSKVINVASIDAYRLNAVEAYSYYASKSALVFLTRRLAARMIGNFVNVTGIAPGAFATDLNAPARDGGAAYARRIPSRRIGRGEDMAAAAIYLASRGGDYVVGETIIVDGGLAMATMGGVAATA